MRNLVILFVLTLASAWAGIALAGAHAFSRLLVPLSGAVLVGVAAFLVLPEVAGQYGWATAMGGVIAGFALVWLVNRYLYSVCPACSHSHDHQACSNRLHGFTAPLLAAAGLHSFFDGWSLGVANQQSPGLRLAFLLGIGIHKVPEGIALGVLFLAATGSAWKAWGSCAAVQSFMLIGGAVALAAAPLEAAWVGPLLSMAAGIFLYLGYHAVESEYRLRNKLKRVPL